MSASHPPTSPGSQAGLAFPPIAERWLAATGVRRKDAAAAAGAPDAVSDVPTTDASRLRVVLKRAGSAERRHDVLLVTREEAGAVALIAALRLDPEEGGATPLERLAAAMDRFGHVVVVASRRGRFHEGQTVILSVALPVERVVTVVAAAGAPAIDCHVVRLEPGMPAHLHVSIAMSLDVKAYGEWLARRPWRWRAGAGGSGVRAACAGTRRGIPRRRCHIGGELRVLG
jgi:hypothetical protein